MRKIILWLALFILPATTFAYTYGSDQFINKSCTSDSNTGASYTCDKANDGNDSTFWQSQASPGTPTPYWIRFNVSSSSIIINKLGYKNQDGPYTKDFTLQASDNDSTWTDVATSTHGNNSAMESWEFPTSTVSGKYWRLLIRSTYQNYGYDQAVIDTIEGRICTDCGGGSSSSTTSTTGTADTHYTVALLIVIAAILGIDLTRRMFAGKFGRPFPV